MTFIDSFRRAGRSLRNAKGRTILTSLAIAVGAFTLTAAMAVGEGARQYADSLIGDNINPQALMIVVDEELFQGGSAPGSGLQEYNPEIGEFSGLNVKLMSPKDIKKLEARDELVETVPHYDINMINMGFEGSDKKYVSTITTFDQHINTKVAHGKLPEQGTNIKKDEVIVPLSFTDKLIEDKVIKSAKDLIGKKLTLTTASSQPKSNSAVVADGGMATIPTGQFNIKTTELTVVAISDQGDSAMTGGDTVRISHHQAKEIYDAATTGTPAHERYVMAYSIVKDGLDVQEVKESLEKDGFTVQTAEDLQALLFTIVNILQGIVAGFGVLALIASVFGIINTQYISVLERTQQIGLMKALGMRGRHVSRLFQLEAAWIGLLGGAIGALLAIGIGTLVNPFVSSAIGFGEGSYLLIFQPIPILLLLAALILVAMLAGYFPAKKASKLDPIEALRTE